MLGATDLKNGVTFLSYGKPYQVVKYALVKMGRGGATVKLTARNLETGSLEEKSYSSNATIEDMTTRKRKLQFLFKDTVTATFMDPQSYDQTEIPLAVIGEPAVFLKEGELVDILFWEDKPLSVDLLPKVTLTIAETDPGIKGNTASNIYKSATCDNGVTIKVPLFIEVGDKVRVDTRTGAYVERARNEE